MGGIGSSIRLELVQENVQLWRGWEWFEGNGEEGYGLIQKGGGGGMGSSRGVNGSILAVRGSRRKERGRMGLIGRGMRVESLERVRVE